MPLVQAFFAVQSITVGSLATHIIPRWQWLSFKLQPLERSRVLDIPESYPGVLVRTCSRSFLNSLEEVAAPMQEWRSASVIGIEYQAAGGKRGAGEGGALLTTNSAGRGGRREKEPRPVEELLHGGRASLLCEFWSSCPIIAVICVGELQSERARTGWLLRNDRIRESTGQCWNSYKNVVVHGHTQDSRSVR